MKKINRNELTVYVADEFSHDNIDYIYTTKHGGVSKEHLTSLNLGFSLGDDRENVIENYDRVAKALNGDINQITATCQVHENHVSVVTENDIGNGITRPNVWKSDALVTNLKNVIIGGFYADCVVMLFHDRVKNVIGVAHSGWRGTALNIIKNTIDAMTQNFGTNARDVHVLVGPAIKSCHFETDSDVPDAMKQCDNELMQFVEKRGVKYFIDLHGICKFQLENCGIKTENITVSEICTYCNEDDFWSHRRTRGVRGVHGAFIKLTEEKN